MDNSEAPPDGAIGRIVDPDDEQHLGWIIARGKVEVGYAVRADDGATLVQPYHGEIPSGARMVVVLEVIP